MTDSNGKDGTQSGMFGIGLEWDADGKIKPPLTEEHEKLDLKVVAAKNRWYETKSDEDYERFEALEQELDQAINKAFETFDSD